MRFRSTAAALAMVALGLMTSLEAQAAPPSRTSLIVHYQAAPTTQINTWTLRCNPPSGSHPEDKAACKALKAADPKVFQPTPPDAICLQIFGGPQRAEIKGILGGRLVHALFDRTNGCEIDRWNALSAVLG